ncbi:hypothetical protein DFH29DRAFT_946897 [Suillus ampliporus]|nr:hypothetical protein DFH29DRAFT_946897 [Suillus ampliporus]
MYEHTSSSSSSSWPWYTVVVFVAVKLARGVTCHGRGMPGPDGQVHSTRYPNTMVRPSPVSHQMNGPNIPRSQQLAIMFLYARCRINNSARPSSLRKSGVFYTHQKSVVPFHFPCVCSIFTGLGNASLQKAVAPGCSR